MVLDSWKTRRCGVSGARMLSGFLVIALGLSVSGASAREDVSLEEKRAALLLSRATYGPRPGDYERILAMGTEVWLEEQLRPERIDDSELEEKLEHFPDLMLSTRKLMEKYPRPSRAQREAMQARFDSRAPARPEMPEAMAKRMQQSQARRDEMIKEMEARRAEMEKQMEQRRKVAMERKPFARPAIPARKDI